MTRALLVQLDHKAPLAHKDPRETLAQRVLRELRVPLALRGLSARLAPKGLKERLAQQALRELQVPLALRGLSARLARKVLPDPKDLKERLVQQALRELRVPLARRDPPAQLDRPGHKVLRDPLARVEGLAAGKTFKAAALSSCQVESRG